MFCFRLGKNLGGNSCADSATCGNGGFCNFDYTTKGTCEYCKDIISCEDETFITQKGKDECKSVCEASTTKTSITQPTKLEGLFLLAYLIYKIIILFSQKDLSHNRYY